MITKHIVQSMAERIVNAFSPEKIIVFGSWARNEATKDSDIDFLVITSYKGSKRDIQVAMRRELKGFGIPKDVIVASKEEIEQKKDLPGYIYGTALKEGRVVYERIDQ
ncbi:MAG: nucleotidyltransferase domain-containing protein [Peptococcaceae bacterium]|jgi:predicted nucleotidyltransferase|nr:nucleotidyltransferase domain-containing protein [Peptococcaceae bacterium]MDH7524561.1 nucleotidyltransferase domain-containing protein [Peptococcaceae bacterium]